jgi:hypothetical protein
VVSKLRSTLHRFCSSGYAIVHDLIHIPLSINTLASWTLWSRWKLHLLNRYLGHLTWCGRNLRTRRRT